MNFPTIKTARQALLEIIKLCNDNQDYLDEFDGQEEYKNFIAKKNFFESMGKEYKGKEVKKPDVKEYLIKKHAMKNSLIRMFAHEGLKLLKKGKK